MAREKGMGNLQQEKGGRWTMRVSIGGKRYCRSTRTKDKAKAERTLQRFLAHFGLGEHRLPLAEVWLEYVKSPNRNDLAHSTMNAKRIVWLHFAKWMEHNHLEVGDLAGVTPDAIAEYLACLRVDLSASTYNSRVCVLREIFRVLSNKAGLEDDPWKDVRLRPDDSHTRREFTTDELKRILKAAWEVGEECRRRDFRTQSPSANAELGETCAATTPPPDGVGYAATTFRPAPSQNPDAKNADKAFFDCGVGASEQNDKFQDAPSLATSENASSCVSRSDLRSKMPSPKRRINEWYALFVIGIYIGQRLKDCCRLEWRSVNFGMGIIQLIPSKTRRHSHGVPVTIPIHSTLREVLEECKAENPDGQFVLPGIAEQYVSMRWFVSQQLKSIFKKANITTSIRLEGRRNLTPDATFHSLRHTFVSLSGNAGIPLHFIQAIVGHTSTAMTRHYYHESLDVLRKAVEAIPAI